ncbi:helix-turn-helix transcriptional regulator [Thermodesulfobacteriota bacterium]
MEEYLTVKELSERIKLAKQTIYNMIHKNEFVLNTHYYKPKAKIILFKWSSIEKWLEGDSPDSNEMTPCPAEKNEDHKPACIQNNPTSSIKI